MVRAVVAISVFVALALASQPVRPHERHLPRRIEISVTVNGFEPSRIPVLQHEEVKLVFLRKTDATCVRKILLQLDRRSPDKVAELELSLNQPTILSLRFVIWGSHAISAVGCKVRGSIEVDCPTGSPAHASARQTAGECLDGADAVSKPPHRLPVSFELAVRGDDVEALGRSSGCAQSDIQRPHDVAVDRGRVLDLEPPRPDRGPSPPGARRWAGRRRTPRPP